MSEFKVILLSSLIFLVACSSAGSKKAGSPSNLSLSAADSIVIGQTTSSQTEQMLGTAKIKVQDSPNNEVWLFCDEQKCSQGRITLGVNTVTHLVTSVAWNVRAGDVEASLEKALAHFPSAMFKKKRFLNDYVDYFFESESYSDLNKGIIVTYDPSKKAVTTIYRVDSKAPIETAQKQKVPVVTEIPDRDTASSP
jgi:hypothetical protein